MRYIEVERVDETHDRYEYEQYCFPDSMTDDDLIGDELLIEDFEEFIHHIDVSNLTDEELDNYIDNCGWYFYEIDEEEYYGTEE